MRRNVGEGRRGWGVSFPIARRAATSQGGACVGQVYADPRKRGRAMLGGAGGCCAALAPVAPSGGGFGPMPDAPSSGPGPGRARLTIAARCLALLGVARRRAHASIIHPPRWGLTARWTALPVRPGSQIPQPFRNPNGERARVGRFRQHPCYIDHTRRRGA